MPLGRSFALGVLCSWIGASCIDTFEPDVGPLANEICVDEDSNPDRDVSYAIDIAEGIFQTEEVGCLVCHAPTAETPFGFEVSGLDVSSYESLRSGGSRSGLEIIVPGKPCQSIIVQKVAAGPPFGARMPLNGEPFLSTEDRQLLHDWIVEGAKNN